MTISNPVLNQAIDMITVKSWKGVSNGSGTDYRNSLTTAGDVCFVYNPTTLEGRFVFRDNDTIKSSALLTKDDIFSKIQSYRKGDQLPGATPVSLTKFAKKITTVKLNPDDTTNGTFTSIDTASLTISLRNHLVIGVDNTYLKQGFAQLHDGITDEETLVRLAKSLVDNMRRDANLGIKISIGSVNASTGAITTHASLDTLTKNKLDVLVAAINGDTSGMASGTSVSSVDASTDSVLIEEIQLDWDLGKFTFERPDFVVSYTPISVGGVSGIVQDDYEWCTITNYSFQNIGATNGYAYADLEYFCQAMRGNTQRKMFFPFSTYTQPLIDPTLEYESFIIDYAYKGDAEDVQKSPAQLYIVAQAPASGTTSTIGTIISALETAFGY